MTQFILKSICLGMLALLAVACGDAGDARFDEDAGFVEEGDLVGDENENDLQNEVDPNEDADADEGSVCGDGTLDDLEQCDDGNITDGDGCSSACEHELQQILGQIDVALIVDDLSSNEEPLSDTCTGPIDLELDVAEDSIVGDGQCAFDTFDNFLAYELDAEIFETGVVEGTLNIIMNGRPNELLIDGFIDKDLLTLEFDGVTLLIGNIRGVWSGAIEAARD